MFLSLKEFACLVEQVTNMILEAAVAVLAWPTIDIGWTSLLKNGREFFLLPNTTRQRNRSLRLGSRCAAFGGLVGCMRRHTDGTWWCAYVEEDTNESGGGMDSEKQRVKTSEVERTSLAPPLTVKADSNGPLALYHHSPSLWTSPLQNIPARTLQIRIQQDQA
jgi:hypothetical protein